MSDSSLAHSLPGSSVHGVLQARTPKWVPCSPAGDLPDPKTEPTSLTSPILVGVCVLCNWRHLRIPQNW